MLIEQELIKKTINWNFVNEIYKIITSRISYSYKLQNIFFKVTDLINLYDFTDNEFLLPILNKFIEVYCDKKIDENFKIGKFIQIQHVLVNVIGQINYRHEDIEEIKKLVKEELKDFT